MVQTLFDIDQPLANYKTMTYNLQPSQQLVNIRSVLASRKRKSNILSSSTPASLPAHSIVDVGKKQKHVNDGDTYNGLPSPPVECILDDFPTTLKSKSNQSPPLTPNTAFSTNSSVVIETNGNGGDTSNSSISSLINDMEDDVLSLEGIKSKLAALREEKHNMFQLLKRLVEQEEQQQQQQQQQQLGKKRKSRWSSPVTSLSSSSSSSSSSYQRPSPLSQQEINNDNNAITSSHSTLPASQSSFHSHANPCAYHGGQQQSSYLC